MGGNPLKFRFIKTALIWAVFHFVLTILCMFLCMGSSSEQFDNPDYSPSPLVKPIGIFAKILMQPFYSLWTPWMSRNMPDIVENLFFFGNSILWGLGIATGVRIWTARRNLHNQPNA